MISCISNLSIRPSTNIYIMKKKRFSAILRTFHLIVTSVSQPTTATEHVLCLNHYIMSYVPLFLLQDTMKHIIKLYNTYNFSFLLLYEDYSLLLWNRSQKDSKLYLLQIQKILYVAKVYYWRKKAGIQLCEEFTQSFHLTIIKYGQHFLGIGVRREKKNLISKASYSIDIIVTNCVPGPFNKRHYCIILVA